VEKIIWLRQHYHFGPAKIAMYLARYYHVTISTSGVWRILKRLGLNRLPASALPATQPAVEPLRKATPRPPAASRREIHRTTRPNSPEAKVLPVHRDRRLHPAWVLRAYPRCDQKTASPSSTTLCLNCPSKWRTATQPNTPTPTTAADHQSPGTMNLREPYPLPASQPVGAFLGVRFTAFWRLSILV
jgi:hypothetical protein